MSAGLKQLNPFETKSLLTELLGKLNSVNDIQHCLADFEVLDAQEDKSIIEKVLSKELLNASTQKIPVICFMLEHFIPKEKLVSKFWEILKNQNLQTETRITILNLLRDLDADWSYESCDEYVDDASMLLDENTKQLLNNAIINPEVQIDFMDFMATIRVQDKIALINSLASDFGSDALANILIPVFVSDPESAEGKEALKLLADTKSVLGLHILERMKDIATGELLQEVKRSLSAIKISGMREDNTREFYKKILSGSSVHKCYVTYPDGHGDVAMIFTRKTDSGKIRFVAAVINVETGIKDCFGFFEISEFEYSKILERFLKNEKALDVDPKAFKTILNNAELKTFLRNQNKWKLPYEYVCWKSLLTDIEDDSRKIYDIVKENVKPLNVDSNSLDALEEMKVTQHWFLNYGYSDEFEDMLKQLSKTSDMEELIEDNIDKIFYDEEKQCWTDKLIFSAYLKFSVNKIDDAGIIYGVSSDEAVLREMFKRILKRSIYEYLMIVKYDKATDNFGLTHEDIENKIKYIEEKWVRDV